MQAFAKQQTILVNSQQMRHSTIVGHFDRARLIQFDPVPTKPIDADLAKRLMLEEFPNVEEYIEFCDGYVECLWAPLDGPMQNDVYEFAYELAKRMNCIAAEMPGCIIEFPEEARQAQEKAWKELTRR